MPSRLYERADPVWMVGIVEKRKPTKREPSSNEFHSGGDKDKMARSKFGSGEQAMPPLRSFPASLSFPHCSSAPFQRMGVAAVRLGTQFKVCELNQFCSPSLAIPHLCSSPDPGPLPRATCSSSSSSRRRCFGPNTDECTSRKYSGTVMRRDCPIEATAAAH